MINYDIIEFSLDGKELINKNPLKLTEGQKKSLENGDAIYIYKSDTGFYIGQTTNFRRRNNDHYTKDKNKEEFIKANFKEVIVIFSEEFNGTVLNDIENRFIVYFRTDGCNLININDGQKATTYAKSDDIESDVILKVWEEELYKKRKWVNTPTLNELRNNVLFKYSPIKTLSENQEKLLEEIIANPSKNYVVNGDAGTGKTVLLTHLVAELLDINKEKDDKHKKKIRVLVQPNWEKTARNIFEAYGMQEDDYFKVSTSNKVINEDKEYDIIIVDEAHKLSRRYGKQQPTHNKVYKRSKYKDCNSHLEILQKIGKQIILMYDIFQKVRPANISREMFKELTNGYEKRFLKTQFRIKSPVGKNYTSDDYINGIKYLLYKDTGLLESELANFNPNFNRDVFRDKSVDAYFGYFKTEPLHNLTKWLGNDRTHNKNHINRILAGLVEPWSLKEGRDSKIKQWHEGDIHYRWNSTQEDWLNSRDSDAKFQIGSIFSVQGLDLNKVGVLIGNDLEVDSNGKLKGNPANLKNRNSNYKKEEMKDEYYKREFTLQVLNNYYVLLTRGIDGVRLGFWENDGFRKYMEKTLEIIDD